MKLLKVIVLAALGGVLVAIAFASWYRFHHSMELARSFDVGSHDSPRRVLIATQGSKFKESVLRGIVEHLKRHSTYVKVIDLSGLQAADENQWNAIVVIHTWEMGKPAPDATAYLQRARDLKKTIVLTTSGEGRAKPGGVDAIASASKMEAAPSTIAQIIARLDSLLNLAPSPQISQ